MERRTMTTDRRSIPRSAPHACPHCSATRLTAHHFRDAGELGPEAALQAGFCPVLAARRTSTPWLPSAPTEAAPFLWSADDARIAARIDQAVR